jgi:IS605 OrfB family transposase
VEQVLTLVCQLQPTTEQSAKIDALLASFADGCNYANQTVKPSITSKTIIVDAKTSSAIVAIEDLTGIRERTNQKPRNKTERRRSNSWAFYELRHFLEYKSVKHGVEVIAVPPAYTSQTCHCCNHIGLRSEKLFKCANQFCGWHGDADFNGSMNIANIGAVVTRLRGSEFLSCCLSYDASGLLKASPF